MKNVLRRLFVKAPLALLAILALFTLVIPFLYWVITGKCLIELWIDKFNN
jgi:hypothetical protein